MARSTSKSHLVIDQKGSRVVVAGLLISFLIGLTIKAVFSPARIQYEVERLITESKPNGTISIEKAYLSFSNTWWPELAIIVKGLKLQSRDLCLGEPLIGVNSLRLPVSMTSLWQRRIILKEIELESFTFHVRHEHKCEKKPVVFDVKPSDVAVISDKSALLQTRGAVPSINIKETPIVQTVSIEAPNLRNVHIDSLIFTSDFKPGVSLIFEDVVALVSPQNHNLEIGVEANMRIKHASIPNERDIKGQVEFTYKEDSLIGELSGTWREGYYQLQLDAHRHKQGVDFVASGELRHIPLSQILPLMNYYSVSEKNFTGRQSWLSSEFSFERNMTDPESLTKQKEKYLFKNLKFEGEFGEILAPEINLTSVHPAKVTPFEVQINDVDLQKLIESFDIKNPFSFSAELGVIAGQVKVNSFENQRFNGDIINSKYIFSNKGRRDILNISRIKTQVERDMDLVALTLGNFEVQDGEVKGQLKGDYHLQSKELQIRADFNKIKLTPRIELLMSGNAGRLSDLGLQFQSKAKAGSLLSFNGHLKLKEVVIDRMGLQDLKLDLEQRENSIMGAKLSVQKIDLTGQAEVLKLVSEAGGRLPEDLNFEDLKAQFFLENPDAVKWGDLTLRSRDRKWKISSLGFWNERNEIFGGLRIDGPAHEFQEFEIVGTRKKPSLKVKINGGNQ